MVISILDRKLDVFSGVSKMKLHHLFFVLVLHILQGKKHITYFLHDLCKCLNSKCIDQHKSQNLVPHLQKISKNSKQWLRIGQMYFYCLLKIPVEYRQKFSIHRPNKTKQSKVNQNKTKIEKLVIRRLVWVISKTQEKQRRLMLKSRRITACCLKFRVKWDQSLFEVAFDIYF